MKENLPRIAESEWRVLKILWKKAPQSAAEIIEKLSRSTDWTAKTIKTLLNRLVNKQALGFDKDGRSYLYYPLVSEKECKHEEIRSFMNRVFDGAMKPMIATYLESGKLSKKDLEELKNLLDKELESES